MVAKINILLLLLTSAISGAQSAIQSIKLPTSHLRYIINGEDTPKGRFPFMAFLAIKEYNYCGASLISRTSVLTAAHCCEDMQEIVIGFGTHDKSDKSAVMRQAQKIIMHERYNTMTLENDLCVLKHRRVNYTKFIKPIKLPQKSNLAKTYVGVRATAIGWGATENGTYPKILKYGVLRVISNDQCRETYDILTETTLCAESATKLGEGICDGDSGGPLALKVKNGYRIIGIVSFGSSADCTDGYPNGFVRVTSYWNWIRKHSGLA